MSSETWVATTRAVDIRAIPSAQGNGFEGLACKYDVRDSYGTTFRSGCFTRGGLDTGTYALLWQHDPTHPVGTFNAVERADGLYIEGRWDENSAGQEARAAALSGSASDLSVGFTWQSADGETDINKARLMEVSQVTSRFGAVPGSILTAVRIAGLSEETRAGRVLSADNEKALRDAHIAIGSVLDKLGERAATSGAGVNEMTEERAVAVDPEEAGEPMVPTVPNGPIRDLLLQAIGAIDAAVESISDTVEILEAIATVVPEADYDDLSEDLEEDEAMTESRMTAAEALAIKARLI